MTFHVHMGGGGPPFSPPPNYRYRVTHFDWITSRSIPISDTVLIVGQDGLAYYVEEQFSSLEPSASGELINTIEKDSDSL